ncbi:MAG: hypothetical protein ACTSYF_12955, partial [Promethearchaeota archaeon]
MKNDLIKILSNEKNLTHIFILTYNIDFLFIQSLIIPQLRKCGNPKLTILADSECAIDVFERQGKYISALGIRYRVIPVGVQNLLCFHPKALVLIGKNQGQIFIGSGNLSFGGWRENAEIWIRYDSSDEQFPIWEFYDYLEVINSQIINNSHHLTEIKE